MIIQVLVEKWSPTFLPVMSLLIDKMTAGAASGAVGGSAIGSNSRQNVIGAIGGAVVGGIVGAAIEQGATKQTGVESVVETSNGALLTIVQGDNLQMSVGDKVLVMYGSPSRIIPYNEKQKN